MNSLWEKHLQADGATDWPDLATWQRWRQTIRTDVGGLADGFRSEMVLHGYNMIKEMTGKITFIQGYVLSITGRLPTRQEDRLLNAMFINTALSDPRFWLFRTPRLAATVKSPPAACMAAGILTNEASFFGSGAAYNTSTCYLEILTHVRRYNMSLEDVVVQRLQEKKIISGFGRVLARGPDERNPALLQVAKECGLDQGEYLKMAFEVEALLQQHKSENLYMNSGGLKCAILLDLGFTPKHIMLLYSLMFVIGMAGNVSEAYDRPSGQFLPLQKDDIHYMGPPLRKAPKRLAGKQTVVGWGNDCRIVVLDTVSHLSSDNRGDIIVCGSHGGLPAAEYVLTHAPRAIILHDAGQGKDCAGTAGLTLLDNAAVAAVAVDYTTARIGDGRDMYEHGVISVLNMTAKQCGVSVGMHVKEAVHRFMPGKSVESGFVGGDKAP